MFSNPLQVIKHYWGYSSFRTTQEEIINSVLKTQDTLALLPTGGGKSICFQVPALLNEGICIVITPLIALMKDQVEELKSKNIRAAAIYSGLSKTEIDYTLDNFIYGDYKFLYLSPERLLSEIVIERIKLMNVNLLAIDEAHCISQWGHDFRPSYLRIPEIYPFIPKATKIALTATATFAVVDDIKKQLQFKNEVVFKNSFARENLSFSVFNVPLKEKKLLQVVQNVAGSAIVYVKTRRRAIEISEFLNYHRISATYYHGGLSTTERFEKQKKWLDNKIRIMVATNAFGMGINKPDVRIVAHVDMSESLEGYYQEAGRAGRDGLKSYVVALYNDNEIQKFEENVLKKYVPVDELRKTYQHLCNYYQLAEGIVTHESFSFDLNDFTSTFGLNSIETHYSIKLLEQQEIITLSDSFYSPSKLQILISSAELYNYYLKYPNAEKLLKTILRIYGGDLFTSFIKIAESEIAQAMFMSEFELKKQLKSLNDGQILDYQPQRNTPQLTFLSKRYDANKLPINAFEIENKKKAELMGAKSVIAYITEQTECRMTLLQKYFGEENPKNCGICDNCLKNNKVFQRDLLFSYKEHLLEILPVKADDLIENNRFQDINLLKMAISHLLESELVTISEMGVLEKKRD